MKTDEIIKLIAAFGIGTIVSAIFSFIKSTKRNQLDYITKERSEWRKGIRKIIVKLLGSDLDKKKIAVNQLKTQLNPYGFRRNYKYGKDYYMADGHIWDELEDFDFSENRIQRIVQYLVLLLKFDWERSKDEVGIDQNNIIWNALRWILIVLNSVMLVWAGQVNNEKNTYFALISLILLLLQKRTLKLLSGLNLDSRKSQFAFFIAFIFVFLLPYIYSIHLVVLLLNFYKIIKLSLILSILPILFIVIVISSEVYVLYQIYNLDSQYVSKIKILNKNVSSYESEEFELYNKIYELEEEIDRVKKLKKSKDIEKSKKRRDRLQKKLDKLIKENN
ncbi:hypothetical protein KQH68_08585 [Streptococcus sanguinis]|uniref:Uncharacterized protein n=1 Tax=Streptococcus sanguinis TaxID=1305 RepID=A0A2X3Y604_STRSA|nr:hypothetical protein [Streptococcus sanguinis]MBF1689974.1 hypothetical protein [Streptococcus cristatus]MBZ2056338.1 hypothetical protein [Streptococcus sanguinis]RSI00170.1 hypothetical protein D8891_00090 [Streptococcus sanguinis]SQF70728.1 Uncharacterised protein [Streptococcus sanguinis]